MKSPDLVLFCSCSGRGFLPDNESKSILSGLAVLGNRVISISDMCGMAAKYALELHKLINDTGNIAVIACHPRTVKWLFNMAGIKRSTEDTTVLNLRELGIEQTLRQIAGWTATDQENAGMVVINSAPDQWEPWFPVIDYDRCNNCKQCMSFCLFGVYGTGEDGIAKVSNPWNCKNNCPACARVCPEAAIIFPKCAETPINGAEIIDEDGVQDNIRIHVDELLGDDIYIALAERRKKVKTLLLKKRDSEQADLERNKCSGKMNTGRTE